MSEREIMEFDVLIVGAGPAGLTTAIRLAQLDSGLRVCVLEKGAEVGAHILSGAVLEPRALNELFPDWQQRQAPLFTQVTQDSFMYLTRKRAFNLPVPFTMDNQGNYIISLGVLCRWLAERAEELGVDIYPGFAADQIAYSSSGQVEGVITKDVGIDQQGNKKSSFQAGMLLRAKYTVLAEGCRGSLTKKIIQHFKLDRDSDPQTYGLGVKEVWEIEPTYHRIGTVIHTIGWPLRNDTYGGSFLYHLGTNLLAVGFVVGLDYSNPYLSPFEELQRFKTHPKFSAWFESGRRISYGARALNEGGYQSIPHLAFPGGLLVGCGAGFLNVAKIKGTHTAMKSGLIAAESIYLALQKQAPPVIEQYEAELKKSWVFEELYRARNIRPSFQRGLLTGICYSAIDSYVLRSKAPWTFHHKADYLALKNKKKFKKINYPKPDNKISFDKLTSVHLSNTYHEEEQPVHLKLNNIAASIDINFNQYDSPEQRYCPGGVYEIVQTDKNKPYLQINAQNCLHCKACDIKDPTQNINWEAPEGGGGPNYSEM